MKLCPPGKRSDGARRLLAMGKVQQEIAARLGVSQGTVARWLAGEKRPGPKTRVALQKAYGIDADAWDRPPVRSAPAPPAAPPSRAVSDAPAAPSDAAIGTRALALAEDVDRLRNEAWNSDAYATTSERAKTLEIATRILERLGRLTGEMQEISQARIMKLPKWRRLQDALLRAVVDALHAKGLQTHAADVVAAIGESLTRLGLEEG